MSESEHPNIYELMGRILAELPAIGKDQHNTQQGFYYRGMDDVLNALNPILSKYGVFVVPDVIERLNGTRTTAKGGILYEVNLHVRFRFYGPAGDFVEASGWGEGTDSGDKATNKAMTNALKYVLFQAFAISTEEQSAMDSDRYTPEGTVADEVQCSRCGDVIEGARSDREPMRAHLVAVHGFVRQDDGTVLQPRPAEAPTSPPETPQDTPAPADDADTPQDTPTAPLALVPDPDPQPVDEPGDNARALPGEIDWATTAKGSELRDYLKSVGLPVGGTVPEMRDRVIEYLSSPADDNTEAESTAPDVEAEPTDAVTSTGVEYECPADGCDAFPFSTVEAYQAHWAEAHEEPDDTEEPIPAGADGPASEAEVAAVMKAVSGLRGEGARAYAAYRTKSKLPKPNEMTSHQTALVLDFVAALP